MRRLQWRKVDKFAIESADGAFTVAKVWVAAEKAYRYYGWRVVRDERGRIVVGAGRCVVCARTGDDVKAALEVIAREP